MLGTTICRVRRRELCLLVEGIPATWGSEEEGTGPHVGGFAGSLGVQEGFFCCLEGSLAELWQGHLTHYPLDRVGLENPDTGVDTTTFI